MATSMATITPTTSMPDDFVLRSALAAVGIALVAGPLGCFVVWRRMANFGDALGHSSLLGVAISVLLGAELYIGVAFVVALVALILGLAQRQNRIAPDTLIGIAAHTMLALGLVAVAFLPSAQLDVMAYLFGDVLAASSGDLLWIWFGGGGALLILLLLWQPMLAMTIDADLAAIEGLPVNRLRIGLMLLLAFYVALAIKIVGAVLAVALLIVPPAAARRLATTPEGMAVLAAVLGAASGIGGIALSVATDAPAGPAIVVVSLGFFILISAVPGRRIKIT